MSLHFDEGPSSRKRARSEFTVIPRTKRPINKSLISVAQATVDGTQVVTTLLTVTFPCTITGVRWDLSFVQDAGTGNASFLWAVIINREGLTIDTMSFGNASSFYNPETNCLVFGSGIIDNNLDAIAHRGHTKTMRKMQGGDVLAFIMIGTATNTSKCQGVIQFFCKT